MDTKEKQVFECENLLPKSFLKSENLSLHIQFPYFSILICKITELILIIFKFASSSYIL